MVTHRKQISRQRICRSRSLIPPTMAQNDGEKKVNEVENDF